MQLYVSDCKQTLHNSPTRYNKSRHVDASLRNAYVTQLPFSVALCLLFCCHMEFCDFRLLLHVLFLMLPKGRILNNNLNMHLQYNHSRSENYVHNFARITHSGQSALFCFTLFVAEYYFMCTLGMTKSCNECLLRMGLLLHTAIEMTVQL